MKRSIVVIFVALAFAAAATHAAVAGEWARDRQTGCEIWHGHPNPPAGMTITWTGACEDGKGAGTGVFDAVVDGRSVARYEGRVAKGRATGPGSFTNEAGDKYVGEFRNGRFEGDGVLMLTDGMRYEGEFKRGAMHGKGLVTLPDGTQFEMWMGQPVPR